MSDAAAPLGVRALGVFFIFGTCMSGISFASLLTPCGALEVIWRLNPPAREAFTKMGARGAHPFERSLYCLCTHCRWPIESPALGSSIGYCNSLGQHDWRCRCSHSSGRPANFGGLANYGLFHRVPHATTGTELVQRLRPLSFRLGVRPGCLLSIWENSPFRIFSGRLKLSGDPHLSEAPPEPLGHAEPGRLARFSPATAS